MVEGLAALVRHPEFKRGSRDMLGITLGISAWGLVTGVAMVKSGLGVGLSLLMSLVVFAGSSQLASLPLLAGGAPLWVLWATAFCVNLRFVIFSAQWRLYFEPLPRAQRLFIGYFAVLVLLHPQAKVGFFLGHRLTIGMNWVALAGCAAVALAPYNINVNAICPGTTVTDMSLMATAGRAKIMGVSVEEAIKTREAQIPIGRRNQPDDIAAMAAFLASPDADQITGQAFNVDGGLVMY